MTAKFQLPEFETKGANIRAPQTSRRDLLEASKLSRLPRRDNVLAFQSASTALCANCGGRLNPAVGFQTTVLLCGECLRNYANINAILDAHSDRKIRRNFKEGNR